MKKEPQASKVTTHKARKAVPKKSAHPDFKRPGIAHITGRTTSLRGAFFAAITPVISPDEAEVETALALLGMTRGNCQCAYCGNALSEWDHFFPIVRDSEPTGYITELGNLVPSCGKCNQSKGNAYWADWMRSDAPLSPKSRNISDLEERIARLRVYETSNKRARIDYAALFGEETWSKYKKILRETLVLLETAEEMATQLRTKAIDHVQGSALPAPSAPTYQIDLEGASENTAEIAVVAP